MKRGIWLFLGLVDVLSKMWGKSAGTAVMNSGLSFGLLPKDVAEWLSLLIWLGLILVYFKRYNLKYWPLGLIILGGGLNILDRLIYGGVVDIIRYPIIPLYGNIADIYIVVGVVAFSLKGGKVNGD